MKIATLCLLIKNGTIILARKKKKIGTGKFNGYGGKVEGNDTIEQTAVDEVAQECGTLIKGSDLEKVAILSGYIDGQLEWIVHVFIVRAWMNHPKESKEMGEPETFNLENIPYQEMLSADQKWMPLVLDGKKIKANIYYDPDFNLKVFSHEETVF